MKVIREVVRVEEMDWGHKYLEKGDVIRLCADKSFKVIKNTDGKRGIYAVELIDNNFRWEEDSSKKEVLELLADLKGSDSLTVSEMNDKVDAILDRLELVWG